ncbi:unnamed protein product [Spirodela intermedia]|uniref:Uncharacterized protein n=1 Tax=Spirodela intermedia TaxID=51605 RepID=A0A7I8KFR7_SPIIN|nr:unnamed protein product [Spirodela intermedia]
MRERQECFAYREKVLSLNLYLN